MKINTLQMMCMETLEKNSDYLKPIDKELAESIIDSVAGKLEATGFYKDREEITNDVCVMFPHHARMAEINFSHKTPYIISKVVEDLGRRRFSPSFFKLLDSGVSPNIRDKQGNGIFHHIIMDSSACDALDSSFIREFIQDIINSGADINCRNNDGKTPSDLVIDQLRSEFSMSMFRDAIRGLPGLHRFELVDRLFSQHDALASFGARPSPGVSTFVLNFRNPRDLILMFYACLFVIFMIRGSVREVPERL